MDPERVKIAQDVATALAHELRSPVYAIASAARLLRYRVADDPVIERNLGRILREAEHLNALVSALVEYGRPDPVYLAPANPDDLWTSVLHEHRGALEAKAILACHTRAEPRVICRLDSLQLGQAFSNVLVNAIEAAPEGSDLMIGSSADERWWRSTVRNDGVPIAPETLARAFDPLVSTKPGHAGVGLAIAHRVVSEHAGSISLESTAGVGTTLTFTLPASHG
jgi:two-component system, NtrC family, sensor histidine kinase HydH